MTRDTWHLIGLSFGVPGAPTGQHWARGKEPAGSGISLGIEQSDVDRNSTQFEIRTIRLRWDVLGYVYASLDDGEHQSFNLARPFYALIRGGRRS